MPRISVLPEHIASQIAAGEVVERPSSVVKELVENAIDADATRIIVDISEGCRHIRIADNGSGMEPDDATLAFQRHATSKLSSADDLWQLGTLGFRGEALPSIAAVSRLTCCTRTANHEIGTKVLGAEGTISVCETGCAKGTVIEVEDLFYNVPARLKFLKKPATEFAFIHEIIQSLAITYPQIAFQLSLDGKTRMTTNGSGNLNDALRESGFFHNEDSDSKNNLIPLEARDGVLGMELEGRLASAVSFRGDRKGILTIVNGRPVRCGLTYKALDNAYTDLIPRRFPLAIVHLKVNPAELDVNIHPTKKEVRYSRGNEVYLFLQRQIAHALRIARNIHAAPSTGSGLDFSPTKTSITYAPESSKQLLLRESVSAGSQASPLRNGILSGRGGLENSSGKPWNSGRINLAPICHSAAVPADTNTGSVNLVPTQASLSQSVDEIETSIATLISSSALPLDWRVAGYIGNTYILLETKSGLSIIEQHSAHERVLYEQLLARTNNMKSQDRQADYQSSDSTGSPQDYRADADYRQNLIISLPLELTEEQKSVLKENLSELAIQGFEFEIDERSVACSQVPLELAHKDYAKIIQNMLQELAESSSANPQLEIIKSLACQAAIKNGMPLAPGQIIDLLDLWHTAPRNATCPHGRPIQLDFSYGKLFQLFHPA